MNKLATYELSYRIVGRRYTLLPVKATSFAEAEQELMDELMEHLEGDIESADSISIERRTNRHAR